MSLLDCVQVRPSGEAAIVLELGGEIDPALHDRALALAAAIDVLSLHGVEEIVSSYRSVLVRLDPLQTTPDAVVTALGREPTLDGASRGTAPMVHDVPVSFSPRDAPDMDAFAAAVDLPCEEVIARLGRLELRVYMYGFAPGFAYLGGVPPDLAPPRRTSVRAPVEPGSLILAAGQAAFCPVAMPTGWFVVGRTRVTLFDPRSVPPAPFAPGDRIRVVAM